MQNIYFLILIAVAVAFEVSADILFKFSIIQNKSFLMWCGVALYTVATVAWAFSLRYETLSKSIAIFTVLSLIAVIVAGVFLFHEQVPLINKVGIALGVVSVILMQI